MIWRDMGRSVTLGKLSDLLILNSRIYVFVTGHLKIQMAEPERFELSVGISLRTLSGRVP